MDELPIILLVLGIVLAIVTLVGHGIWVLLSLIFSGGRRSTSQRWPEDQAEPPRTCKKCGAKLQMYLQACPVCGWKIAPVLHRDGHVALQEMRQQFDALFRQGAIDDEIRARLVAAIDDQERRLNERASLATPASVAPTTDTSIELTEIQAGPSSLEPAASEATSTPPAQSAHVPLQERARKYAVNREAAAIAELTEPTEPIEPPKKREALSRLFAAFMEEKNIRWGELVGGLLIVGCSIALVISFWSQIAAQPLLKFVLFNGVTAALFGVGLYTDRRWKIHTTSHGLLVIATLLVPLNFLAIAAFTQASPPTDLLALSGEAASLVVFAFLVYVAGRILVPGDAVFLAVGVMIPCLMQLLIRRFAGASTSLAILYALASVPLASYLLTTAYVLYRRWTAADAVAEVDAHRVLKFVGLVSVASLMPLALLLHNVPPIDVTLHWLSPIVTLCGLPSLLVGLLFWRRIADSALSALQTVGIGVGSLGALVMLAGVVLAWPDPAMLLPTALVLGAAMISVAMGFGIPAAHLPAAAATAVAWLISYRLLRGDIGWTLVDSTPLKNALLSATSGNVLVPLVAVFGGLAWWLRRLGRREDCLMVGIASAATAVVSLALVVWFGFARVDDPEGATWTLAIFALAAMGVAVVLERLDAARAGSALLLGALVQGIVYRFNPVWQLELPWIIAFLLHATVVALGCAVLTWRARKLHLSSALVAARRLDVIRSFVTTAQMTSAAAAVWILVTIRTASAGSAAFNFAWLAGVWGLLAALAASAVLFTAAQVAIVAAIACGVTAATEPREWYATARHPWLDPWFLQAQGIALAAYCMLYGVLRWIVARVTRENNDQVVTAPPPSWLTAVAKIINPPWPTVDRVVAVGLVVLVSLIAIYAAAPGAAQEWSPTEVAGSRVVPPIERFELASIPHAHAAGGGAWLLLAAVAATLIASLYRNKRSHWRTIGLTVAALAVCPLLAAFWGNQVAVASALRWLTAGFFALASVLVWKFQGRGFAGSTSGAMGEELSKPEATFGFMPAVEVSIRDLLVAFVAIVYVAMIAYVGQATLLGTSMAPDIRAMWPWVLSWAAAAGIAGLVASYAAVAPPRALTGGSTTVAPTWVLYARNLLLLLAFAPLAVLATFAVAKALEHRPLVGPDPGSWFARIGYEASYGVPLVVIALTLIGYAIRDRSSVFAFAAGLLFNIVSTFVVLRRLARGGGALDAGAWIVVAQVNAIVAGVVAMCWLAALSFEGRALKLRSLAAQWPLLLVTQVALAAALCGVFLIPAVINVVDAMRPAAWAISADGVLGWTAVAIAAVAAMWLNRRHALSQAAVALFVAALITLIALTIARSNVGNLTAYHTLLAGCCAAACVLPPATRAANRFIVPAGESTPAVYWSAPSVRLFAAASVLLAFWEFGNVTGTLWWTIVALTVIAARNVWIAYREGGRGGVWIAALLFMPAMTILWIEWGSKLSYFSGLDGGFEFLWINVLAAALLAVISVWIERRHELAQRQSISESDLETAVRPRRRGVPFHRFAAWAIVVVMILTTAAGLIADLFESSFTVSWTLAWAAWVAAAIVAAACLWDLEVRWSGACLYGVGLIAVGLYLDRLDLHAPLFHWALANALAAYSLATSALWSVRDRLRNTAARLGLPMAPEQPAGHGWLVVANLLIGVGVLLLVWLIEITMPNFGERIVAAYAVGAQAFAIGLLAHGAVRSRLQYLALIWGVFFAVAFGWAWLPPDFPAMWLHRVVVTVVALAVTVVFYGFGLVKFLKRDNEWTRAAQRLVPSLTVLAGTLIFVVLGMEVAAYAHDHYVPISPFALAAVAIALAGLAAAALVAALVPGRDPLGLSERGRTLYVYAAEALAALLFLHIRVTMSWLFQGWFMRFWPITVMVIAFVGVGLGEVFQRRKQRVLSEPLETTGALLPLLPALGFWIMSSQVHYSLLLLSIGVLYATLCVLRRSFLYGMLAAIAANGALWFFLSQQDGLNLTHHPQLWLVPPALCALIAGYINRARLTQEQSAALRYASAIVIYVSSTADVFINGVADAPWLPAVLAGLSILGVLAGIVLRVRAFLYLGTAFLVVALMTVIWHAAEQRTWIWWVAGIITGSLIIALFGLFEKRRDDVIRVVEELKHWES